MLLIGGNDKKIGRKQESKVKQSQAMERIYLSRSSCVCVRTLPVYLSLLRKFSFAL